jgi:DnaJ homolog subfamily B member 12
VFNMGGPGIRVTQFGGPGPRRRPRAAGPDGQPEPAQSGGINNMFASLLPLILLFVLPLISSFLSGPTARAPQYSFTKVPPFTTKHTSGSLKVAYFVNPAEYDELSRGQRRELDKSVEVQTVQTLRYGCHEERGKRDELIMEAQGWFSTDEKKMDRARKMDMKACKQLQDYGLGL